MPLRPFDPAAVSLPLDLAAVPLPITSASGERWSKGLGDRCPAVRELLSRGVAPPFAVTGCTIFLVSSHFDITGGVYWREQVTYHRPVRLGETLSIGGRVEQVYVHDGRRYQVMTSRTLGEDGTRVATSRSTGLGKYRRDEGIEESAGGELPYEAGPDFPASRGNPLLASLRELRPGAAFESEPQVVTLQMMRDWSAGDERNPIHTDPEVARKAGWAAPIAGGPHVLAFLQEMLMERLGAEALSHGSHFDVRWVSPVQDGGTVVTRAAVTAADTRSVTLELKIECDGRTAMVGAATIPLQS
ncbi:hypothetical protein EDM76_01650 [bacterium]|nr:MAG: hypothetical protein EDM76_01650 [bacterium]MCL4232749.1 hypothetical protein [Dehalococcoidia bacterium]